MNKKIRKDQKKRKPSKVNSALQKRRLHEPIAVRVILSPVPKNEGGGYVAEVPSIKGCVTQGETREDALRMAQDAIECWLDSSQDKEPYPLEPAQIEEYVHLNWVTQKNKLQKLRDFEVASVPNPAERTWTKEEQDAWIQAMKPHMEKADRDFLIQSIRLKKKTLEILARQFQLDL